MKTIRFLVAMAGVATTSVLTTWYWQSMAPSSRRAQHSDPIVATAPSLSPASGNPSNPLPLERAGEMAGDAKVKFDFRWSQIETTNYATFVENLRHIECPEQTIREIVAAELKVQQRERARALFLERRQQFWRPEFGQSEMHSVPESEEAGRELQELVDMLLQSNGASGGLTKVDDAPFEAPRFDGPLAPKQDALRSWWERFDALEGQFIQATSGEDLTLEQANQLTELRAQRQKELASLLTPSELTEYDVRYSSNANALRDALRGIDVTEAEFRALFLAEKSYDAAVMALDLEVGEELLNALEEAHHSKLAQILTDERLERFLHNIDLTTDSEL